MRHPALPLHLLGGGTRRRAGSCGENDAARDGVAGGPVRVERVLERRAHDAVDERRHLRVVEALLRLALELRVRDLDGEHRDQALAHVLGGDREAARHEVVDRQVVAHRLREAGAEAVLVRPARRGRDAVHEGEDALVRRLGPRERGVQVEVVLLLVDREDLARERRRAALADDLPEVRPEPVIVAIDGLRAGALVVELDGEAAVEIRLRLERLRDALRVEADVGEDLRVGTEEDRRAAAAPRTDLLERPGRLPTRELLLPLAAVAPDARDERLRERRHDRRADAVEAAGVVVVLRLELAGGVERREDQLERRLLVLRVAIDRDAAPVVGDRRRRTVRVERHRDAVGVAVHRLVDRVVDELPEEMMEPGRVDAADVHAGPPPDRLEAFEYEDVLRRVARRHAHSTFNAATPPRFTTFCPFPDRRPSTTSARPIFRSVPSGVTARNVPSFGSASAPTIRSSSSLLGRMRITPRPGPASSATSLSAKRSIFPRRVATTTIGPRTGSTETISSPSPTRASRRPARVVSERSGSARKP